MDRITQGRLLSFKNRKSIITDLKMGGKINLFNEKNGKIFSLRRAVERNALLKIYELHMWFFKIRILK